MRKINLEEFKKRKFIVFCNSKEKSKEFLKKIDKTGLNWGDGGTPIEHNFYHENSDGIFFMVDKDGILQYDILNSFDEKIIKF